MKNPCDFQSCHSRHSKNMLKVVILNRFISKSSDKLLHFIVNEKKKKTLYLFAILFLLNLSLYKVVQTLISFKIFINEAVD